MWFANLPLIGQVSFIVACIGTGLLVFKIILLIFGISDITDIAFGLGRGAVVILLQGFVSMMAVGGWTVFGASMSGLQWWASLLIGLGTGLVSMGIIALLYRAMTKLELEGTLDMQNGVGKSAEVYLVIPAKTEGNGKVSLTLQGRMIEANAVTKGCEPIKTGESVRIVAYENNMFVVERA